MPRARRSTHAAICSLSDTANSSFSPATVDLTGPMLDEWRRFVVDFDLRTAPHVSVTIDGVLAGDTPLGTATAAAHCFVAETSSTSSARSVGCSAVAEICSGDARTQRIAGRRRDQRRRHTGFEPGALARSTFAGVGAELRQPRARRLASRGRRLGERRALEPRDLALNDVGRAADLAGRAVTPRRARHCDDTDARGALRAASA